MAIIKRVGNFLEKFDEFIVAGLLLPVIQKILDVFMEKGAKKIGERVEKILGFSIEEAKRDITDEILYGIAVYKLSEAQAEDLDAFEERLRREDCCKAEAFVLYTAKIIKYFEQNVKETIDSKKDESTCIGQEYKKLEKGVELAKKFLEVLLKKTGADENATFQARVTFLQGKNVFSLIPTEKGPDPIIEAAKKLRETLLNSEKENFKDLTKTTQTWADSAKAWRDSATKRR